MKGLFPLLTLLLLSACSTKPDALKPDTALGPAPAREIFIVSHGWHTGFVIPAADLTARLPALKQRFKDAPLLELGWGDKGFYQAEAITVGITLRAIFWPTESVIHAVGVTKRVERYFPDSEIERLCLSADEYDALVRFIDGSFQRNAHDEIVPLKTGLYGDSQFYQGVGDYYLMNTCNKWTAKGLQSAGMDISPTFKLTAGSILSYLHSQEPPTGTMTVGLRGACGPGNGPATLTAEAAPPTPDNTATTTGH